MPNLWFSGASILADGIDYCNYLRKLICMNDGWGWGCIYMANIEVSVSVLSEACTVSWCYMRLRVGRAGAHKTSQGTNSLPLSEACHTVNKKIL